MLLLSSLFASTGCFVPKATGEKMQADILALQREMQQANKGLDEQRAALTEQMQRAEAQVDEVSKALSELRRAAHMTDADFGVQIERLIKELQELRGTIELTEYRLSKIESQLSGEGSLTVRVEALEAQVQGSVAPSAAGDDAPKTDDPKQLLAHARKLAKEGKVGEARGVYRDIIKRAPDEAGVADEAYFRLGELYYDDKKYRSALQEYIKVAEKFPKGHFADDALYKIGVSSMDIGNLEDAQIFFAEIVKSYRKSPLVGPAKRKLDEIRKRLDKEKAQSKRRGRNR